MRVGVLADTGGKSRREWLAVLAESARASGDFLRLTFGSAHIESAEGRDMKLGEDRRSEALILSSLTRATTLPVLAEEGGWSGRYTDGLCIVIDPLDGSMNFKNGVPLCGVSIALCDGLNPLVGCVYDFVRDELFAGGPGLGLFVNGRAIEPPPPARDILATGFPLSGPDNAQALQDLGPALADWRKVRMVGSAALSLAWVAAGRFDGYAERGIRYWDVAGGAALVLGAGGSVRIDGPGVEAPLSVSAARDQATLPALQKPHQ